MHASFSTCPPKTSPIIGRIERCLGGMGCAVDVVQGISQQGGRGKGLCCGCLFRVLADKIGLEWAPRLT